MLLMVWKETVSCVHKEEWDIKTLSHKYCAQSSYIHVKRRLLNIALEIDLSSTSTLCWLWHLWKVTSLSPNFLIFKQRMILYTFIGYLWLFLKYLIRMKVIVLWDFFISWSHILLGEECGNQGYIPFTISESRKCTLMPADQNKVTVENVYEL